MGARSRQSGHHTLFPRCHGLRHSPGLRLTLALHFVLPEDDTVRVLKALLRRIAALAVPVGCLLLDKGFAGIETMAYLSKQRLRALIACPIRGKKAPNLGGTRALCQGRKSYSSHYTFCNSKTSFTVELVVCRVFTTARRTGRMQRRSTWLIFIVIGPKLEGLSPRQVRRTDNVSGWRRAPVLAGRCGAGRPRPTRPTGSCFWG